MVSINFDPDDFSQSRCLVANKNDNTVSVTKACNIGSSEQLFRINRAAAVTLKLLEDGPYARILHRETGKCVIPETVPPVVGTKLILGACNINSGFNWLLSPPVKFDDKVTPNQIVFTTSKKFPPKNLDELKKIIADENPLSMISKTDSSISLDVFGIDNKDRRYITQILNYEIYKEITTAPNVSNLGINFPF